MDVIGQMATSGVPLGPFCDDLMKALLQALWNPRLPQDVKLEIVGCLGDLALSLEGLYARYLGDVMKHLATVDWLGRDVCSSTDPEMKDYLNRLRAMILVAYTSILQVGPAPWAAQGAGSQCAHRGMRGAQAAHGHNQAGLGLTEPSTGCNRFLLSTG